MRPSPGLEPTTALWLSRNSLQLPKALSSRIRRLRAHAPFVGKAPGFLNDLAAHRFDFGKCAPRAQTQIPRVSFPEDLRRSFGFLCRAARLSAKAMKARRHTPMAVPAMLRCIESPKADRSGRSAFSRNRREDSFDEDAQSEFLQHTQHLPRFRRGFASLQFTDKTEPRSRNVRQIMLRQALFAAASSDDRPNLGHGRYDRRMFVHIPERDNRAPDRQSQRQYSRSGQCNPKSYAKNLPGATISAGSHTRRTRPSQLSCPVRISISTRK